MTSRRIVVVRLAPRIPGAVTYAALNSNDKSADITISGGGLTATSSSAFARVVRSDLGLSIGSWYWETFATTANNGRGGVARSPALLSQGLGTVAAGVGLSIGGPDSAGLVRRNDATIDTGFGAIAAGDTVCHWWESSTGTYRVRLNGGAWFTAYTGSLQIGQAWYPALECDAATGSQSIRVDPATFVQEPPPGVRAGLYHAIESTATNIYVSSDPYVPDAPLLLARLSGAKSELVIERHAKIWPWALTGTDRRGRLVVLNGDRRLDAWGDYGWRDAEYEILVGNDTDDFGDFVIWSKGVIDSFGWDDRRNIVLELADPLARLDEPLQQSLYPVGTGNLQIVGKPEPITLGEDVRMFPTLLSTQVSGGNEFTFAGHDDALFEIIEVSDRGDIFEEGVDWNYLPGRNGFQLVNEPDNPISARVSGAMELLSVSVPRSGVDSDFVASTWAGSPAAPAGWTNASSGGGTVTEVAEGAAYLTTGAQIAALDVTLGGSGARTWRVDVVFSEWTSGGAYVIGNPGGAEDFGVILPTEAGAGSTVVDATATIRVRDWEDADFTIASVRITEVTVINRLPAWLRYLCVTRGGFDLADVDVSAAEDLDEKAPYTLAWHGNAPITILKLLRMVMDSFTGWVTSTRAGLITVGRLEADQSAPVALVLNTTNIKTISQRKDVAENFTQRMGGKRNFAVHSGGDISPDVTQELQAELLNEWGAVREAGQLDTPNDEVPTGAAITDDEESNIGFQHAIAAPLQETLLDDASDVHTETNRAAAIIGGNQLRWWDVVAVLTPEIANAIEIGQRATITMPIEDLDAGRDSIILGAVLLVNSSDVRLVLLEYPEIS